MKVWKIMHVSAGRMSSYNTHYTFDNYLDGKVSLEYFKGEITKPTIKGSLLYAFDNLKSPLGMFLSECEIWRCEATGVTSCPNPFFGNEHSPIEFWKRWNRKGCKAIPAGYYGEDFPGCVLCETIMPIRRATDNEIARVRMN